MKNTGKGAKGRVPPAPKGNTRTVKHGLYRDTFEGASRAVYDTAPGLSPVEKMEELATFIMGRIHAACATDPTLEEAKGEVAAILREAVKRGRLSEAAADRALRRITLPELPAISTALSAVNRTLAQIQAAKEAEAARAAGQTSASGIILITAKNQAEWASQPDD